ncbi:MAG: hypothetical protein Fur0042_12770 [Cyanophyceae cyanobacterium]
MTRNLFPEQDRPLVDFLRQHRPSPPPPARDLEADLMAAIAAEPPSSVPLPPAAADLPGLGHHAAVPNLRQWFTLIPALAAGFALAWGTMRPPQNSPAIAQDSPEQELATFFEASWNGSLSQTASYDWMSSDPIAAPGETLEVPGTATPAQVSPLPSSPEQPGDRSSIQPGAIAIRG